MARHARVRLRRSLAITGAAVVTGVGLTTAGVVRGLTAPAPAAGPPAAVAPATAVPPGAAAPAAAPSAGPARGSAPASPAAGPARGRGSTARSAAPRPATAPTTRAAAGPAPDRAAPSAGGRSAAAGATVAARVLAHVNAARAAHGLPALRLDDRLSRAAAAHTAAMAGGCGMSHRCPGEAALGDRLTAAGAAWRTAGENVGYASAGPGDDAVVRAADGLTDAMLAERPPDDGHRRNLLGAGFGRIGLGVTRDGSGVVWLTQDFAG